MDRQKYFILTEAAATVPLVRRILVDVRRLRAERSRLERSIRLEEGKGADHEERLVHVRRELAACLAEARTLGVEITSGVRCEALFPFEHQWVGPSGDGRIRLAYFVYNDALPTIRHWFFAGWPNDRRCCAEIWWSQFRGRRPAVAH